MNITKFSGKAVVDIGDYNALILQLSKIEELETENSRVKLWFEKLSELAKRAIAVETSGCRYKSLLEPEVWDLINYLGVTTEEIEDLYRTIQAEKVVEEAIDEGYQE